MELDEKFNLLRTLTQKIRSYDKHLIDTVTFCNNKMSSIVYDYYPFEVEIRDNNLYFFIITNRAVPLHNKTADSILPSAVFILSEFTYAPPDTFQYPLDSISGLEARQG